MRLGLVGSGVADSPSRPMQEAALRAIGRDGSYEICDVDPTQLLAFLAEMRSGRFDGCNVTIPYKMALAAACDQLEGDGQLLRVVNTITVDGGRLIGDNTDARGFELALQEHDLWPEPGSRALVVGAGGAAAAVALALARLRASYVVVTARSKEASLALAERLVGAGEIGIVSWDRDAVRRVLASAAIVVNATPIGLVDLPFEIDDVPNSCTVADVRYRPRPVDLVAAAADAGLRACDGVEMLLQQGMLSLRRWTGQDPPYAAARAALTKAVAQ